MTLTAKTFPEIVTYTRASGATRVNAAGLIVGVDFSSTSNTITTGSKTFTLTADANVNRDWPVGSSVIAVSQAGAVGTMTGTVTSYTPSTQVLVINVASVTGSGTSTNWRIGSLEFRRDFTDATRTGGLVEGGATNILLRSEEIENAYYTKVASTVSANAVVSPNGSQNADILIPNTVSTIHHLQRSAITLNGSVAELVLYARPNGYNFIQFGFNATGGLGYATVDLTTGVSTQITSGPAAIVNSLVTTRKLPSGWVECRLSRFAASAAAEVNIFVLDQFSTAFAGVAFAGDGTSGVAIWGMQIAEGGGSYIPTTTVSVTRAADLANVDGARFSQFYAPTGGTAVLEVTPIAAAVQAVAASFNDGTVNNAIRIAQKQSGTLGSIRKMATDGVTDVMAINALTGNTLRSNGFNYDEISDQSGVVKLGVASSGVGSFLNVGGTENFRSSADSGQTYNARTIGGLLLRSYFGIGRLVIAGGTATINGATVGSVIVSPDGLAYRRVNIPGLAQQVNGVTGNGTDRYVLCGAGGIIYTSPDAETWTPRTSGTSSNLNAIAHFNGRYVTISTVAGASRYSDDAGVTWTAVAGLDVGINNVAHNGVDQWIAVGNGGALYTSADGISWTVQTSNTTQALYSAFFADGTWVVSGNVGTILTSANGVTWVNRTATSGLTQALFAVGYFSGKFYVCGGGGVVADSTAANILAGTAFTTRTSNVTTILYGISTNGTRLFVSGDTGGITTSDDGIAFTSRTGNAATLNGSAFGAGTYVIVGNAANGSGLIATVDPVTFAYTRRVSGTTNTINDVAFLNGAFYAPHTAGIQRSTDGITYTTQTVGGTAFAINRVSYDGTRHIAVGAGGRYTLSTDNGLTWSASALNGVTTQNLNGLASFGGLTVACGNAGTIITTTNGTTYTLRTSGTTANLFSVMYSTRDSMWYAAGDNGTILRAADPTGTWENISNDAIAAVTTAGVVQANPFLANLVPGTINKIAIRLQANNFGVSVNGAPVVTDASVVLPVLSQLSLGMNGVNGGQFNGWLRKKDFFTTAYSDAELVSAST